MLFIDEVKNLDELMDKIEDNDELNEFKVCVICFIFDNFGNLILNRRGLGARDEIGKLQALGGSVNSDDPDFRSAMLREIKEEAGEEGEIDNLSFIASMVNNTYDVVANKKVNWIILGYKANLISGKLVNNEPERSDGFIAKKMEDFLNDNLSLTTKKFIEYMLENNQ